MKVDDEVAKTNKIDKDYLDDEVTKALDSTTLLDKSIS